MRPEFSASFRLGTALAALLVLPLTALEAKAQTGQSHLKKQTTKSQPQKTTKRAAPPQLRYAAAPRAAMPIDDCRWRNIPFLRLSCPVGATAAAFGSTAPGPNPGPGPGPSPGPGPGPSPALGNPGNAMSVGRAGEGPPNDSRTAEFGFNPGPGVQGMSDSPGGPGNSGSAGGAGASASAGSAGGQGGGGGGGAGGGGGGGASGR
jgi:hypothetical protein